MRKYQQLLLLVLSIFSLSLFIIYRHEYNRLHYVLEVFNFFGSPCNVSTLILSHRISSGHDWGPTPLWQEIETGHIYSAFQIDSNTIKLIGVTASDSLVPRNCYGWPFAADSQVPERPIIGKLTFRKNGYDSTLKLGLYQYTCVFPTGSLIDTVSLIYKSKRDSYEKRIPVKRVSKDQKGPLSFSVTVCTVPALWNKRTVIEFLSFHTLIGVDSFIIYNRGIPHKLVKTLMNLSEMLNVSISFQPWNFPKTEPNFNRLVVELDCSLRTLGESHDSITLELNEYIVMMYKSNITKFISEFDVDYKRQLSDRISLPVQTFCINNADRHKPIAVQNIEVYDPANSTLVRHLIRNNRKGASKSYIWSVVEQDLASIHRYVPCKSIPNHYDNSISRFSEDFTRSTLFQLYLNGQI